MDPHASGGSNLESNLVTACGPHHDLIHKNRLAVRIDGLGFRFVFPDGRTLRTAIPPNVGPTIRGQHAPPMSTGS